MKKPIFPILIPLLLSLAGPPALSQELSGLKDKKPFTASGYLSTNQVYSAQPTDSSRNTSYTGYYTGAITFGIYGMNVPLTFTYSNQQGNFTHPFNQFALHPSYKWAKAHIGYATMAFTPYTLSGRLFYGAGIELAPPGTFHLAMMYGRLNKAVNYDSSNTPAYKRTAYGFKAGISGDRGNLDLVLFRATDRENSIAAIPDSLGILPEDNAVLSVSFQKKMGNLSISGEYASSYLTTDTRTEDLKADNALLKPATWFMAEKTSTVARDALKANATYHGPHYSAGIGYERIDPDYTTLGTYYFTNDLENITVSLSANFWENKLAVGANAGLQRDNLDNSSLNNNKRTVGSGTLSVAPGERLNLAFSYSNFTSYTNVRSTFDYINEIDPYENWDTLDYRQISQNANLNGSYQLTSSKENRQSLSLNLTWQASDDRQGDDSTSSTRFYNAWASYIISFSPISATLSASLNYNRNETISATAQTWGPVLNLSKAFLEKTLRVSTTASYSSTSTEGGTGSSTLNLRLTTAYSLEKRHRFNCSALYQHRDNSSRRYHTYSLTFGYAYNFNLINNKENPGPQKP